MGYSPWGPKESVMTEQLSIAQPVQEMQVTWVQSLDQEGPLVEEMATHSSILAWKIQWTEKPGRLHSMELQKSQT